MYKKILVPLDGSKPSAEVLPHVRGLANCFGAEIALLRVVVFPPYDFVIKDPAVAESAHDAARAEAREYIERIVADLRQAGFTATGEICEGVPADVILGYAEEIQADLIALSTHGHSRPARWFVGSVADKLIRGVKVPMLLFRPSVKA